MPGASTSQLGRIRIDTHTERAINRTSIDHLLLITGNLRTPRATTPLPGGRAPTDIHIGIHKATTGLESETFDQIQADRFQIDRIQSVLDQLLGRTSRDVTCSLRISIGQRTIFTEKMCMSVGIEKDTRRNMKRITAMDMKTGIIMRATMSMGSQWIRSPIKIEGPMRGAGEVTQVLYHYTYTVHYIVEVLSIQIQKVSSLQIQVNLK